MAARQGWRWNSRRDRRVQNAFLTGPLELRTGVTLVIDKGVTLFGSRDPAVYEMRIAGCTPADRR